eukprot:93888-Pyramimonas_sp.AAC.2
MIGMLDLLPDPREKPSDSRGEVRLSEVISDRGYAADGSTQARRHKLKANVDLTWMGKVGGEYIKDSVRERHGANQVLEGTGEPLDLSHAADGKQPPSQANAASPTPPRDTLRAPSGCPKRSPAKVICASALGF